MMNLDICTHPPYQSTKSNYPFQNFLVYGMFNMTSREEYKERVIMIEILRTRVSKWNSETCGNYSKNERRGDKGKC